MRIRINGQDLQLSEQTVLSTLLAREGYGNMKVAVAHNGAFVHKRDYDSTALMDGDELEILAPSQGG